MYEQNAQQRVVDHVDGDLVLVAVGGRAEERGRGGGVDLGVAPAGGGAGHRLGGDHVALAADQQLGAGADEAVDCSRRSTPGSPIGAGAGRPPTEIGASASTTTSRASTTLSSSPARMRAVAAATASHHSAGRPAWDARRTPDGSAPGSPRPRGRPAGVAPPSAAMVVSQRVPSASHPTICSGTTSGALGPRVEREGTEGDGPAAGPADVVVDLDRAERLRRPSDTGRRSASPRPASPTPPRTKQLARRPGDLEQVRLVAPLEPPGDGDEVSHGWP